MGKGNDPNCALCMPGFEVAAPDPQHQTREEAAGRRGMQLVEHARRHRHLLTEPLPAGWGLLEQHVEQLTHPSQAGRVQALSDVMTSLFPGQARTVEGRWLTDEQRALAGGGEGRRTYLAVQVVDPKTAEYTPALRALMQFEQGRGPVAEQMRAAELMGRVEHVRNRIEMRCRNSLPGFPPEDQLPDDWLDQMIAVLRDERLSETDDLYDAGVERRHLARGPHGGVHKWTDRHINENSLRAAAERLGFLGRTRQPA